MTATFLDFATVDSTDLDTGSIQALLPKLTVYDQTRPEQVNERIAGCEYVFLNKVNMTRDIIEANPELKFIGITATGYNNIDTEAALENNVAVCNISAYCTQSVVEHVFGLILNLSHSLLPYIKSVREGMWQRSTDFCMLAYPISDLGGKTLGIIGYGELGKGVEKVAKAFNMRVLVAARKNATSVSEGRHSFEQVLEESDIVSLHCPLTKDTQGLIGRPELQQMKSSAILINTARGGLVDSKALVEALQQGQIAGAGIDVLSQEPPVDGDPLLDYMGQNLIVTPHTAWASVEARQNALEELANNIRSFQNGERRNRVV